MNPDEPVPYRLTEKAESYLFTGEQMSALEELISLLGRPEDRDGVFFATTAEEGKCSAD